MKTKLFKTAWALIGKYNSFSEALTAAWKAIKLNVKMKSGVINFDFKKVDGSIRQAVGTLMNVPAIKGVKAPSLTSLTYFDVEANYWRSAKIENLIF